MRALICINLHFLLLPFLCISATLSLGSDGWSGISLYFVFFSMQFDATTTIHHEPLLQRENCELQHVKKKWVDLGTFRGKNGIARTFALKVIVPLGINLTEFDRAKQNQTGSHI